MGAREVIAKALQGWFDKNGFLSYENAADIAAYALNAAGYVILSPDEVRGIQNALRYAREGLTVAGSMPLSDADTVEAIDAAIKALEARDG